MIYIFFIIFILFSIFPLVISLESYNKYRYKEVYVDDGFVRVGRFFGKSFSKMIERELPKIKGNVIFLTREEDIDKTEEDGEEIYPDIVENLVVRNQMKASLNVKEFKKEIYCKGDVDLSKGNLKIRAAYSKGEMKIGANTIVKRWIDAEKNVYVFSGSDLGLSASSNEMLSISEGVSFKRLYGKKIEINSTGEERKINYPEDDIYENKDIKSKKNIKIKDGEMIFGNISSKKNIYLGKNVFVTGNVFADGNIFIGENTKVCGNIMAYKDISVSKNVELGQNGVIVSVISRGSINFKENTDVYGFVSCEKGGFIKDE